MSVRILVTGGTFDKVHDPIQEALVFDGTRVPEMLERGRVLAPVEVEPLMLIDSLQMTDEHRKTIAEKCSSCRENRIVVTHGTSTMIETARVLAERVKDKTIVLTGALVPHSIKGSDALFNLAHALGAVQVLPPGVFIAMNGRILPWDSASKDVHTGVFRRIMDAEMR
jgi:L-asparaginase